VGRPATQPALDFLNTKTGTRPLLVLGISWGLGVNWYSTKEIILGGIRCQGNIMSIGDVTVSKREDSYGTTGNVSVTLADLDSGLKFVIDNSITEKAIYTLFLAYEELGRDDMIPLLRGTVAGPVEWIEGTRDLRINLECHTECEELGYAPTKDDIENLWSASEGVPWPHIFGKCAHVPAVKIRGKGSGLLLSSFHLYSKIYENNRETENVDVINDATQEKNKIYIDSQDITQNQEISINIDGVIFKGKYNDGVFTVSEANAPIYRNVAIGPRDNTDPEEITRAIFNSPSDALAHTLYLTNVTPLPVIVGCHCYFEEYAPNYCIAQNGAKCTFLHAFYKNKNHDPVYPSDGYIKAVYPIAKCGVDSDTATQLHLDEERYATGAMRLLAKEITQQSWSYWNAPADTKVTEVTDFRDKYVLSGIRLTEVNGIYVKRKVRVEGHRERDIFEPLGKDFYSITLNDNTLQNNVGNNVTTLELYKSLDELGRAQDYSDTLYTTGTSSVGPSVPDIIKYIIENYTTRLNVDNTSFEAVKTYLPNSTYNPTTKERTDGIDANFAFLDHRDALKVCQEIAWQGRCALTTDSELATLVFLDTEPSPIMTFDESLIELKTMELSSTPVSDIYTRLVGTWNKDYRDIPRLTRGNESIHEKVREIVRAMLDSRESKVTSSEYEVYTNNVDKYGIKAREEPVYIYNNSDNVIATLKYWGYIGSNSWKLVKFNTFLPALILKPFDAVAFNMSDTTLLHSAVLGIVHSTSYNHKNKSVALEIWLPVKAGTTTIDNGVWNE
jgi:hypothetical protein